MSLEATPKLRLALWRLTIADETMTLEAIAEVIERLDLDHLDSEGLRLQYLEASRRSSKDGWMRPHWLHIPPPASS